jgi:predicted dehydrogenase
MSEKVRIGVIGAGWVAQNRHLPALAQLPGVALAAIWSRNAERGREVAGKFGIPRVVEDWRKVAEATDVDAVVIATPPVLHHPATLAALGAGKHVLCQARMARNVREARAMVEAARAAKRVTALYPPRPGLRGDRVMRRLLHDEGFVGEIREVRVTSMALDTATHYVWATDASVVGVNAMALGMWAEVLNRWVGPAVRVAATARTHRAERTGADGRPMRTSIPDSLVVAADLACGATASYHLSGGAACAPGHAIEIFGSRGALRYRLFAEEIEGASGGADKLEPIPIAAEEERAQTTDAEFVRAIQSGTPVAPSFEEGLRYMEFCEAVALSAGTGKAVPVPADGPSLDSWAALPRDSESAQS